VLVVSRGQRGFVVAALVAAWTSAPPTTLLIFLFIILIVFRLGYVAHVEGSRASQGAVPSRQVEQELFLANWRLVRHFLHTQGRGDTKLAQRGLKGPRKVRVGVGRLKVREVPHGNEALARVQSKATGR
jgi:hypothetical protein